MGCYRLSNEAETDLIRIHQRGVREFGEARADQYFQAFFRRFEELARNPMLYPAVDNIRAGYRRSVCGADSIYYRVNGQDVDIMRILGRQDVENSL